MSFQFIRDAAMKSVSTPPVAMAKLAPMSDGVGAPLESLRFTPRSLATLSASLLR